MGHFTALGDTARDRAQKQIEEKFRAQNANISVQWEQTAWETIGEKYMAAWSAGTAPEHQPVQPGQHHAGRPPWLAGRLNLVFKQWPEKDQKDLSKAWWDTGAYDGKKYIAPLLLFGDMLLYRKSLFDAVGVNIAEIKTWKQFTEACQKVVVDGQGRNPTQAGFDESTVKVWGWHQFAARSGAGIPRFDQISWDRLNRPDLGPPDWKADHWTDPAIVESIQMVVDWVLKEKIIPVGSSLTYNLEDADNKFVSGLSARRTSSARTATAPGAKRCSSRRRMPYGAAIRPGTANADGPVANGRWASRTSRSSRTRRSS